MIIICTIVLAAVSVFAIILYNSLVFYRNEVRNAWNAMDVQMKRRHDLVPNIIDLVSIYAFHERSALNAAVEARRKAMAISGNIEKRAQAENILSASLRSLFTLAEAYPNLKASESFSSLMSEFTATENKIGFSKQYYNDTAKRYKNRIEMFPGNIVASLFNFRPEPFFLLEDDEKQATPNVKL